MRAARFLLTWTGAPLLLGAAVAATYALVGRGWSPAAASSSLSFVLLFVVLGVERVIPHRTAWNGPDGQLWNDLGHGLFGTGLGAAIGNAAARAAFPSVGLVVAHAVGGAGLWPSGWPIVAQVVAIYLIADLGRYVQHRAMHASPFLWRFHALHHSVDGLNAWKTSRSHIVERVFQQIFMFGPLIAMGAPDTLLMYYIVPNTFLGLFSHCNADFRLGFAEWVFMGPASHRLHHSRDLVHGNTNFGSAIVLWDVLFGTYTDPLRTPPPEDMGIPEDRTPSGFLAQILDPLRPERRTRTVP